MQWKQWLAERDAKTFQGGGKNQLDGVQYTSNDIADFRGKLLKEQTLRQRAERKLKEIQLAKEEQGWVPMSTAQSAIKRTLEPLHRLLLNFPKRYAEQVDPNNPQSAEEKLRDCINDLIRQLQAQRGEALTKQSQA